MPRHAVDAVRKPVPHSGHVYHPSLKRAPKGLPLWLAKDPVREPCHDHDTANLIQLRLQKLRADCLDHPELNIFAFTLGERQAQHSARIPYVACLA